jgi:hypothetical protein
VRKAPDNLLKVKNERLYYEAFLVVVLGGGLLRRWCGLWWRKPENGHPHWYC